MGFVPYLIVVWLCITCNTCIADTYYASASKGAHVARGRIGINWDPISKIVRKVYVDSPADKAGLIPGDRILHINDIDIMGPVGTKVKLTVLRNGQSLQFVIIRVSCEEVDTHHVVTKEKSS